MTPTTLADLNPSTRYAFLLWLASLNCDIFACVEHYEADDALFRRDFAEFVQSREDNAKAARLAAQCN